MNVFCHYFGSRMCLKNILIAAVTLSYGVTDFSIWRQSWIINVNILKIHPSIILCVCLFSQMLELSVKVYKGFGFSNDWEWMLVIWLNRLVNTVVPELCTYNSSFTGAFTGYCGVLELFREQLTYDWQNFGLFGWKWFLCILGESQQGCSGRRDSGSGGFPRRLGGRNATLLLNQKVVGESGVASRHESYQMRSR